MLATMPLSTIPFEGKYTGPSLSAFTPNIGVNDQIKTDTKEWTPNVNCSNLLVFLDIFIVICKIIIELWKVRVALNFKTVNKSRHRNYTYKSMHFLITLLFTLNSWDYSSCTTWVCSILCVKQFQL